MSRTNKRHLDPLELFLDDGFSNPEVAAKLRAAGFVVHEITDSFPREKEPDKREQGVLDPPIIELCHRMRWVMVTTDKDMCKKHLACIRRHKQLMVLATAHNGACFPDEWVDAIVTLEADLHENVEWMRRPWFLFFNRQGSVTSSRDKVL